MNLETSLLKLNNPETARLENLLSDFSILMRNQGLEIKTFSTDAIVKLNTLPATTIENIFDGLMSYYLVCAKVSEKKVNLRDAKAFTKAALDTLGLAANDDVMSTIDKDDIVEIYDVNGRQIFRSFRLYELTQYSLSDLVTFGWTELYERPSTIVEQMYSRFYQILNKNNNLAESASDIPEHAMKEIKLSPPQIFSVRLKYIAPVFNNEGTKSGVLLTSQGNFLGDEVEESKVSFF